MYVIAHRFPPTTAVSAVPQPASTNSVTMSKDIDLSGKVSNKHNGDVFFLIYKVLLWARASRVDDCTSCRAMAFRALLCICLKSLAYHTVFLRETSVVYLIKSSRAISRQNKMHVSYEGNRTTRGYQPPRTRTYGSQKVHVATEVTLIGGRTRA